VFEVHHGSFRVGPLWSRLWFPVVTGLLDLRAVKVEGVWDEQGLCQGTAPKGGAEELIAGGQPIGGQV
jgi:hypothetical protein